MGTDPLKEAHEATMLGQRALGELAIRCQPEEVVARHGCVETFVFCVQDVIGRLHLSYETLCYYVHEDVMCQFTIDPSRTAMFCGVEGINHHEAIYLLVEQAFIRITLDGACHGTMDPYVAWERLASKLYPLLSLDELQGVEPRLRNEYGHARRLAPLPVTPADIVKESANGPYTALMTKTMIARWFGIERRAVDESFLEAHDAVPVGGGQKRKYKIPTRNMPDSYLAQVRAGASLKPPTH